MKGEVLLKADGLTHGYQSPDGFLKILDTVSLTLQAEESLAIVGPSGIGKSTLLHLLAGLEKPTEGEVFWKGESWSGLSEKDIACKRGEQLGFVYQQPRLIRELTVLENVMLPLRLCNVSFSHAREKARAVLDTLGLSQRLQHTPAMLSGGEAQRVAIARAVIHTPVCVLADEPTGNLDPKTADTVMDCLLSAASSLILVTHDRVQAKRCQHLQVLG